MKAHFCQIHRNESLTQGLTSSGKRDIFCSSCRKEEQRLAAESQRARLRPFLEAMDLDGLMEQGRKDFNWAIYGWKEVHRENLGKKKVLHFEVRRSFSLREIIRVGLGFDYIDRCGGRRRSTSAIFFTKPEDITLLQGLVRALRAEKITFCTEDDSLSSTELF